MVQISLNIEACSHLHMNYMQEVFLNSSGIHRMCEKSYTVQGYSVHQLSQMQCPAQPPKIPFNLSLSELGLSELYSRIKDEICEILKKSVCVYL